MSRAVHRTATHAALKAHDVPCADGHPLKAVDVVCATTTGDI